MSASDLTTLKSYFESAYVLQHDITLSTIQAYRTAISSINRWHGSPIRLDELNDLTFSQWMTDLQTAGKPKHTIKTYSCTVLTIWRSAHDDGLCPTAPRKVKRIKLPRMIPEAWTLAEMEQILWAASKQPGHVGPWRACVWWPALLLTIYDFGSRITSTMLIKMVDVHLDERYAIARSNTDKTREDQCFGLSDQTIEYLQLIWSPREEMFGDWPYDRKRNPPKWPALIYRYREILKLAGLPQGPRDLFHKLRRTTGTQVRLVAGKEVAAQCLRHRQLTTFERSYDDTRQGKPMTAADYLPRPATSDDDRQMLLF